MSNVAQFVEKTINDIILYSGNKNEILIGNEQCGCHSCDCTNTQKHILMLLSKENFTNRQLAEKLNISTAAVTKAIKSLEKVDLLILEKDKEDARFIRYILTEKALHIAKQHEIHHDNTTNKYYDLLGKYSVEEKIIITKFLEDLIKTIKG